MTADLLWYKDAVIYELHVKTFYDGNGDGIGDFIGLTGKLDYLQRLGVNCLWLLPFCESPLRDDGYDVSHYERVHPDYGTRDDFVRFLEAAHARGRVHGLARRPNSLDEEEALALAAPSLAEPRDQLRARPAQRHAGLEAVAFRA